MEAKPSLKTRIKENDSLKILIVVILSFIAGILGYAVSNTWNDIVKVLSHSSDGQRILQGSICGFIFIVCVYVVAVMAQTKHKEMLDYATLGFIFFLGWVMLKLSTAALLGKPSQLWGTLGYLGLAIFGVGLVRESFNERRRPVGDNPWDIIDGQAKNIADLENENDNLKSRIFNESE